jgi:hypothetical protein
MLEQNQILHIYPSAKCNEMVEEEKTKTMKTLRRSLETGEKSYEKEKMGNCSK